MGRGSRMAVASSITSDSLVLLVIENFIYCRCWIVPAGRQVLQKRMNDGHRQLGILSLRGLPREDLDVELCEHSASDFVHLVLHVTVKLQC